MVQIVVQMGRYFDEANFDVGGLVRMAHHRHVTMTLATTTNDSTTTSLPQSRRPPLQRVCRRADDLFYNQSAAGQTTSSDDLYNSLPQGRRPPLQLSAVGQTTSSTTVCRRADDLLYNCLPQGRQPLLQPVYGCRAIGNQTIEGRRRTVGAP